MQRLSGVDAAFVYMETPTNHMHVGLIGVFDPAAMAGGYSFAKVRALVESRLSLVPPFRRRLREVPFRLQHPVWVEDQGFDLDYHLRRAALPAPGTDAELGEFAADVFGRSLDRRHPLWEMYVVEGLQGGLFAVVTKIHHAAIDGVSGAEVIARLLDVEAEPSAPAPDPVAWHPDPVPTDLQLVADAGREMISRIGPAVATARRAASAIGNGRSGATEWRWAPKTGFNVAITPHRRFATADVSLDDVMVIKEGVGATVNDVVLALSAGALRQYLSQRGTLPEAPLTALVPVSVRTDANSSTLGNSVSGHLISLATDLSDPRLRLARIAEATAAAKAEVPAIDVATLTEWADLLAPGAAAKAARVLTGSSVVERFGPVFNVVVSNVRGADIPLYLAGAKLVRLWPMGPVADGVALNITVMSYLGRLRFGLVACRETVADLDGLAASIEAEVHVLLRAGRSASPGTVDPPDGDGPSRREAAAGAGLLT